MSTSPPPQRAATGAQIVQERLDWLAQSTPSSVAAAALAGLGVLALLALGGLPLPATGWYAVLLSTLGLRLWLRARGLRQPVAPADAPAALRRHRVAFALHGLAWALLLPLVLRLQPAEAALGALFIWTAMVGAAFVTSAVDQRAAICFSVPAGLSLALGLSGAVGPPLPELAAGAAVFVLMMIVSGRRAAAQFEAAVRATRQSEQRLAEANRHAEDAEDARRDLSHQHALMQQLLRGTSQGFWFVAPDGRTLDVNPAMCELLGRRRDELLGLGALDVFSGEARERLEQELEQRRHGQRGAYSMTIERPDGSVRHAVNLATPIVDEAGHHIGSIGLWTDVTELKALEREQRTYERAMNSVDDLVSVIGPDGCYRLVNDAWCRALGRRREDTLGQPWRSVMGELFVAQREEAYEACRRHGRPGIVTVPTRLPDGRDTVMQTQYVPYRDPAEGDGGLGSVILVTRDISHQERDRAAAETAAESLRRVLEATGDAIYATDNDDPDEPVRFANQQLLDMAGIRDRRPHEVTPADLWRVAATLYADPELEQRQLAVIAAGWQRHEGLVRLRDGRVIYRRFEPARVGGRELRVWSLRDVTAEQQAMALLHDREAQQRALLDAFPGYIARFDREMRYTYVNEPLTRLAGRGVNELLGVPVGDVVGRRRAAAIAQLVPQVLAGQTASDEGVYAGPGGTIAVHWTLAPGSDPRTGEPVVYAFGVDVSELKQAEQRLRERERELRTLLRAFPGHITSVDADGRYAFIDEGLAAMLGFEPEAVVGRSVLDVMGPEGAREVLNELEQARQGRTVEAERRYPDGQGGFLDMAVRHVAGAPDPDGRRHVYTFSLDITARKRAEQALAAARDEADRANRAKSQFLSHMSHELRTPMNAVVGFAQLLLRDPQPPLAPHHLAYAQQILRGASHLLELVNEVLDLARIESDRLALELQPVAADDVAAECLALVNGMARERGVRLLPTRHAEGIEGASRAVSADRTRLRQVLLNLLSNAIKYNRAGGTVQLVLRQDADEAVIEVHDTGPGLEPGAVQRLFVPFERLGAENGPVEGTGIGLVLSQRLVEAMHGRMGVDSRPGEGSVFWLRLPLAGSGVEAAPVPPPTAALGLRASAASAPTPQSRARVPSEVLYIDDNEVNLQLVQAVLEPEADLRLTTFSEPAEGLAHALSRPPKLVLLDIHMPELDGYEVLRRLKAAPATAAVPVVAVSADATQSDLEAARAAGFTDYLTKPVDLTQLLELVHRLSRPGQNPDTTET